MKQKEVELWSPWLLLVSVLLLWQFVCSAFSVSEFIFPSPLRIWSQLWEFKATIAGHAWRTYWVTMTGFGLAIVVGVLLGFVIGSSRLAYASVYPIMTGFNALPARRESSRIAIAIASTSTASTSSTTKSA